MSSKNGRLFWHIFLLKRKFAFSHQRWFHFIMTFDHLSYENPSAQIIVVSPTYIAMAVLPKNLSLFSNLKPSIQLNSIQSSHTPRIQNLRLYRFLSVVLSTVASLISARLAHNPNIRSVVYHCNVYANTMGVLNEFEMSEIRQFYNGIFSTICANYH